jgi:L-ascorbate metabolism protein UlaG (beta-lactamase superfamily)
MNSALGFASGVRLATDFETIDLAIPQLARFIESVAKTLRGGATLSRAVRAAADQFPGACSAFAIADDDDILEQGFALLDSWTFPSETLPVQFRIGTKEIELAHRIDASVAPDLSEMLRLCGAGRHSARSIRDRLDEPLLSVFERLIAQGLVVIVAGQRQTLPAAPGVTRLQHASLLYCGRDSRILTDPHCHSTYEPDSLIGGLSRTAIESGVDAVLITHSHGDHWHLPTLMSLSRRTQIIVPRVPRASMLCPDMAATLRALGCANVVALGWNDPAVRIGDLEVHAVPFYGEQPLRYERPRDPALRNHGNTYVVRHADYTSWFLADAGRDWDGDMREVAEDVRRRFGPIDWVISNFGEFRPYRPDYITGGHYWLSLTADQLKRFSDMADDVLTLGPQGVAEVCRIVGARCVLPYAHWWADLDTAPEGESDLIETVTQELAAFGAGTTVVPWRIGQQLTP